MASELISPSDASAPPALWRNVSFHLLWSSTFASGVGDRLIMNAALPLLGYGEGADVSSIQAGLQFFFFLPYLVWSPFAGWLADRVPRKWLMFAADELRGVIVLLAFTLLPTGMMFVPEGHQWKVWAIIGAVGLMAATFVPAKLSIIPNVVGYASLQRGNAAVVSMGVIGNLVGFIASGLLIDGASVRGMIIASSLCYLISGTFWIFLRTPWRQPPAEGAHPAHKGVGAMQVLRDIGQGIHYAVKHRPVLMLILTLTLVWGGTAIYMPALAVVNIEMYGGTAQSFMFLAAPVGLGMLLGSFLVGLVNARSGSELLIVAGLVGCGLFIGLQMLVPIYALGLVFALMTGVSAGVLLVPINTLIQRLSADHIRGRVFAAQEVAIEGGHVLIAGLIWRMSNTDPYMRPAALILAAGLIAAAVWGFWRYVLRFPLENRRLNLFWRLVRFYIYAFHHPQYRGRPRVPAHSAAVLVSNHTSSVDPLLIQGVVLRRIRWLVAREYIMRPFNFLWKQIQPIPVDRDGDDSDAPRRAVAALREGQILGIFPEGGINLERDCAAPFHPGVGLIARRSRALIVPVFITGTPEDSRGRVFRSLLRPSHSRVVFGEPFSVDALNGDRERITEEIRRRIEALRSTAEEMDRAAAPQSLPPGREG